MTIFQIRIHEIKSVLDWRWTLTKPVHEWEHGRLILTGAMDGLTN